MILFCNTFITETPPAIGKGRVYRENLKSFSNFDIFKYSLASLAVIPWTKVILKIHLDDCYKDRQQELETFINYEFGNIDMVLEWKRNEYQNDWKRDFSLLSDNLIWFYCNHDHIFFDSSTKYLEMITDKIKDTANTSVAFSHWPECIRTAQQGMNPHPNQPLDPSYMEYEDFITVDTRNFDSIQIITRDLYHDWWFKGEFNHIKLPRPDYFGIGLAEIKEVPFHTTIIPYKEICRHFDGYQHINPPITNEQCPAIDIPPGFFENNMKIRYGYDDYTEGCVNINPLNPHYKASHKDGTDYKFLLEDIPYFWRSRISQIDINPECVSLEDSLPYRLEGILKMIHTSPEYKISKKVEHKIVEHYLEPFPEFKVDA